jgi:hypothetical protein
LPISDCQFPIAVIANFRLLSLPIADCCHCQLPIAVIANCRLPIADLRYFDRRSTFPIAGPNSSD